jgi:hypothetical protein
MVESLYAVTFGRAAQLEGASKSTPDVVNPLAGVTPLVLHPSGTHASSLFRVFLFLFGGPCTGTCEPVFLRNHIYTVQRTMQISFLLSLITSEGSGDFLILTGQEHGGPENAHKTPQSAQRSTHYANTGARYSAR